MKVFQKNRSGVEIFEVDGEINFHTSPELRDRLRGTLEQQVQKVLISLRKVSYIDSSGLATFVEALQKIRRYKGLLVLCELAPSVRSVFEIAKLDGVFALAQSEEEAFALLEAQSV